MVHWASGHKIKRTLKAGSLDRLFFCHFKVHSLMAAFMDGAGCRKSIATVFFLNCKTPGNKIKFRIIII